MLSLWEKAEESELFNLEKRRFWGHLLEALQYMKGSSRKMERNLFEEHVVAGQREIAPDREYV